MSIGNRDELQAAISDFLVRDDLASVVLTFVSLAEARINRDLRHYDMEARTSGTISGRYLDLPADWLETVRLHITDGPPADLELVSQNDMAQMRQGSADASGRPRFYAVTAGQIEVLPTPGEAFGYEIVYFARVPALSDASPTNWLLTKYPDIYLYGALVHSAPYLDEDQRTATWAALYQSAIDAANMESRMARHSGTGLRRLIRSY